MSVWWKRSEESGEEVDQRTLLLKFLLENTKEKDIRAVLTKLGGEVKVVEINTYTRNSQVTLSATVILATEEQCKLVMEKAHKDWTVKALFLNDRPSIHPYVSKEDREKFKQVCAPKPIASGETPQQQKKQPQQQQLEYFNAHQHQQL